MNRVLIHVVPIICSLQLVSSEFPVHEAVLSENLERVQALIQAHNNIDTQDALLMTPLHIATGKGNMAIVKALIAAGARLNVQDVWSKTPLHWAALHGYLDIVQELIYAGADVNAQDTIKRTPLFCAASTGKASVIKALIQAHAHLNHQAYARITPLHYAVLCKKLQAVKALAQAGASQSMTNNDGLNASQLATHPAIIEYFNHIPLYTAALFSAVISAHIKQVIFLLNKGAPPLETDTHGNSTIHKAIRTSAQEPTPSDKIARLLIQSIGPQAINVKNNKGHTPLHVAALLSNVWMTLYLLRHGANPNETDMYGNTPLHYASSIKIRDSLLRHRADPTIINREGQNPIAYALQTWLDIIYSQKKD